MLALQGAGTALLVQHHCSHMQTALDWPAAHAMLQQADAGLRMRCSSRQAESSPSSPSCMAPGTEATRRCRVRELRRLLRM